MVYVRSHKFCCCLPVRLGVLIMAVFSTLFSGLIGIGGIIAIKQDRENQGAVSKLSSVQDNNMVTLTRQQRIQIFILTGASLLYCLSAIFGFVGALSRKRTFVNAYNHAHAILLGISIVSGSILLWGMWHASSQSSIDECIRKSGSDAKIAADVCKTGTKVVQSAAKGAITAGLVIYWLIQLYGVVIVGSYVNQLEEERDAKAKAEVPPAPSFVAPVQPAYAPTYQYNPMGGQQQQYAFSSTQNSYGHA